MSFGRVSVVVVVVVVIECGFLYVAPSCLQSVPHPVSCSTLIAWFMYSHYLEGI